jgi:probable rRNA maturation factor
MATSQYPKVNFNFLLHFPLHNRKELKSFISGIFKKEGRPLRLLHYIFCSDDYLWRLNKQHLNHDSYTDIITFDLADSQQSIAEIYISIDRVKENAQNLSIPFNTELHRVIFHGALHLCGYSDKSKKQEMEMRKMEDFYLNKYFV